MSVWYAIPSKRPVSEAQPVLNRWHDQGYRTAVWRDEGDEMVTANVVATGAYEGYAKTINELCALIIDRDAAASWIVIGGDDVYPDPNNQAGVIADQCTEHFGGTVGVMQPTGDRWGESDPPHDGTAYIDRVCGSPWLGRDFCRRAYGGNGPLFHGYTHMFVDEELQAIAVRLGIFWQRRDLIHFHNHWGRPRGGRAPDFLKNVNAPSHWQTFKSLFENRKMLGFPGHELSTA